MVRVCTHVKDKKTSELCFFLCKPQFQWSWDIVENVNKNRIQWFATPFQLKFNWIRYKDKMLNVQTDKLLSFFLCFFLQTFNHFKFDACNTFQNSCDGGYKRSIPKRRSCSQARIVRGPPLCKQLHEQKVLQFKNNISQHTVARNLGISSYSP